MYQILAYGDKPPLKEEWPESRDPFFLNFAPITSFNWWSSALQISCTD